MAAASVGSGNIASAAPVNGTYVALAPVPVRIDVTEPPTITVAVALPKGTTVVAGVPVAAAALVVTSAVTEAVLEATVLCAMGVGRRGPVTVCVWVVVPMGVCVVEDTCTPPGAQVKPPI